MEVNRLNFRDLLPQISEDIKSCAFLSFDGEFTGLSSEFNIMPFDSSKEYYEKQLKTSQGFIIIQLGLSFFKKKADSDVTLIKSYNLYIYPQSKTATFLCQGQSLSFLASNGFDFNKLFTSGISYCNDTKEKEIREKVRERQMWRAEQLKQKCETEEPDTSIRNFIPIPDNEKDLINDVRTRIQKIIDNKSIEENFEKLTSFQRKLIYELIDREFNNKVSTSTRTLDNNQRAFSITRKRTAEEELKIEEGKLREDADYILDSVGLRLLLKEISSSKKLIVGHNCLLDLMFLINQCFHDLPEDYDEFKKTVHEIFPNIIDTKFIANSDKFKDIFNSSVLKNVYERILAAPFNPVKFEWENPFVTYNLEDQKEHEAGFDSFLTGYIFLVILGNLKVPLCDKFEKSKQLGPYLNRIALQRIMTPYIYISGQEPVMSRSHVFFVKFPSSWQTSDIQDMFKNYGPVNVAWADSTTAFVSLYNKENSSCVIKTIRKAPGFEIKSFADYQQQTAKKENLKRKESETAASVDYGNGTSESPQSKRKKTFQESNLWSWLRNYKFALLLSFLLYWLYDNYIVSKDF